MIENEGPKVLKQCPNCEGFGGWRVGYAEWWKECGCCRGDGYITPESERSYAGIMADFTRVHSLLRRGPGAMRPDEV